jgi:tRNA/tmRNA/rRNA uracil-C5-methylase (TrmA/RlmC/RlmD family)
MNDPAPNAPPLAVGQRLALTINDIAFGGEGVGRADDFVVLVPFVLVGEEVEVEISEVKKRFARARLFRVLKPSPERVPAPCRYFGECGGCQYQHMDYGAQLRLKYKQVADLFERVGGFSDAAIQPVIPCPQPYGYRNRIMVRSQWDKFKQGLNIGFIRNDSRLVVDVEQCVIAEPALNEHLRAVRAHPPPKGGLKVVLRLAPEGWEVPRDSFFQNNFFLLPKLVDTVRERLQSSGVRHLVDAYCGVGFFGIELAGLLESIAGIEVDPRALKAAQHNAAARQITQAEYFAGEVEQLLPRLLERYAPGQTAVLLDPPRAGCQPGTLQTLRDTRPAQVVYVSCHPDTLARDLKALCADAVYEVRQIIPLDMFPQTRHIECVTDVRLRAPEGAAN